MWISREFKLFQLPENPSTMLNIWGSIQENPSGQYQQVISRKIQEELGLCFPPGASASSPNIRSLAPRTPRASLSSSVLVGPQGGAGCRECFYFFLTLFFILRRAGRGFCLWSTYISYRSSERSRFCTCACAGSSF